MNEDMKANEEVDQIAKVEVEMTVDTTTQEDNPHVNLRIELKKMLEFVSKYPEIGPTVAQIALKVGEESTARRISAMGTDSGTLRAEYYAVASHVARNDRRYDDALNLVREGINTLETPLPKDDYNRFVKMVKTGFAVLLFNKKGLDTAPSFTEGLPESLERFTESFGEDADFLSLYAQAVWLTDESKAEEIWERATKAPKNESSWNARGTWYKEVAKDISRSAEAYRNGLEKNKNSALLAHNLAQVLIDQAKEDTEKGPSLMGEADRLLHAALKNSKRRGYRRHIHETIDRLKALRPKVRKNAKKTPTTPPPSVNDIVKGKVASIAKFGAFLELESHHRGLLHCSNIAHEHVHNPRDYVKVGQEVEVKVIEVDEQSDGTFRIGFSRKALIEAGKDTQKPRRNNDRKDNGNKRQKGKGRRDGAKHNENPGATLGELLMAKLNEKD